MILKQLSYFYDAWFEWNDITTFYEKLQAFKKVSINIMFGILWIPYSYVLILTTLAFNNYEYNVHNLIQLFSDETGWMKHSWVNKQEVD